MPNVYIDNGIDTLENAHAVLGAAFEKIEKLGDEANKAEPSSETITHLNNEIEKLLCATETILYYIGFVLEKANKRKENL